MRTFIVGILVLFSTVAWGTPNEEMKTFIQSLSKEQRIILESFFQTLFKEFSGYVLCGKKPMCIEGYPLTNESGALSGVDEKTFILLKGAEFWQSLQVYPDNKEYFIVSFDAKEFGYHHLVCINRRAFLKVVNENLSLFRYVLGPTLTADSLLNELINAKDEFYKVLKNDNVLLGILLGYGTQNSLLVAREEHISDAFASDRNEEFPFLSKVTRMKRSTLPKAQKKRPSIGFFSLADECEMINKLTVVSRKLKPFDSYKIPHFGCEPNSEESKVLLTNYENDRKEIIKTVEAKDFIEKILVKLFTTTSNTLDIPSLPENRPSLLSENKNEIVSKLVEIIHQEMSEEKRFRDCFKKVFLQGVSDREKQVHCLESPQEMGKRKWEIYLTEKDLERVENLEKSKAYFNQLSKTKGIVSSVPNKVYFKVLHKGEGPPVTSKIKNVTLHYSFSVLDGKIPETGTVKSENVEQLIPGVVHALIGMKRGEIRNFYIHPEYGYGEDSYLPPNLPIIAKVELVDFEEGENELSFVSPCKIDVKTHEELIKKYEKLQNDQFYENGVSFWDFVKKSGNFIDFQTFEKHFNQKQQDTGSFDKDKFLIDLSWRIVSFQKQLNEK